MEEDTTSTWSWAHDGTNENGIVKFFEDGTVSWNDGRKHGNWELTNNGTALQTTFNSIYHELIWDDDEGKAILTTPVRTPPSTMTLKTPQQGNFHYEIFAKLEIDILEFFKLLYWHVILAI